MRHPGLVTHPVDAHVFQRPLTSRAHLLLCLGNLLFDD